MDPDRVEKVFRTINRELVAKGFKLDYDNYAALIRRDWYPGLDDEIIREPYREYREYVALFREQG